MRQTYALGERDEEVGLVLDGLARCWLENLDKRSGYRPGESANGESSNGEERLHRDTR